MGLLLSILVAAIGVVEFLEFYERVLDNVRFANTPPKQDLNTIRFYYAKSIRPESARRPTSPSLWEEVVPRRRSLSPYPSLDLSVPRNSISSDLQNPSISVSEVDEEIYSDASTSSRATSPEPDTRKLIEKPSPILSVPIRKSRSRSRSPSVNRRSSGSTSRSISPLPFRESSKLVDVPLTRKRAKSEGLTLGPNVKVEGVQKSPSSTEVVEASYWNRSLSPFEQLLQDEYEHDNKSEFTYVKYEERSSSIPLVKISNCKQVEEEHLATSSSSSSANSTDKTLEGAAKILSEQKPEMEEKKPEPFWVK